MTEAEKYNRLIQRCGCALTEVYYQDSDTVTFTGKGTKTNPLKATAVASAGSVAFADITGSASDNSSLTSYISTQVAALVDSSPATLDTLNELAAALGDDPNFATTITNSLATKANLTGGNTIAGTQILSSLVNASVGYVKSATDGTISRQTGVPAADVTAGTFGTGNYTITGNLGATNLFGVYGNSSSLNNARIRALTTGIVIDRNVADANTGVIIDLTNASATGKIIDLQLAGVSKASIDKDGYLIAATQNLNVDYNPGTTPAAPTVGTKIYSKKTGGRSMLGQRGIDAVNYSYEYQPAMFGPKLGFYSAVGSGNEAYILGRRNVGTGTSATITPTGTIFQASRRQMYTTAGTAGSSNALRNAAGIWYRGSAVGKGGLFLVFKGGVGTHTADSRTFIGFYNNVNQILNVDPSTLFTMVGIANDSADSNFQFMCNDGSGTATKVDLGANFPCHTSETDFYEFRIFAPPGQSIIYYSAWRINTGHFVEGSVTSNLPDADTLLSDQYWINNGTTASAASLHVSIVYTETEF